MIRQMRAISRAEPRLDNKPMITPFMSMIDRISISNIVPSQQQYKVRLMTSGLVGSGETVRGDGWRALGETFPPPSFRSSASGGRSGRGRGAPIVVSVLLFKLRMELRIGLGMEMSD